MKNLLVTGGCGFIGSNFINYIFPKANYRISNLDAMYYAADKNNVKEEIRNSDNYTLIEGNLCSIDLINHILKTFNRFSYSFCRAVHVKIL